MFDEPSLGLSPILVRDIFNVIKKIKAEGTTVLIVEQNVKQTLAIADRAYVLENGRDHHAGNGRRAAQQRACQDSLPRRLTLPAARPL